MGKIRSAVKQNPDRAKELMDRMKSGMDQLASKVVHSRSTEKYTSINVKDGYIEFRSPGGDWLNDNFKEIDNTLRRFTVALSAAVNPEAYRQEYLKKLYKLLDVSGEKDPLSYFAKFAAGELPKAALKSFVRQAQLERGVKRGKEPATQEPQQPQGVDTRVDYELYNRTTNAVIDTFPARNDDEAQVRLDDYREHGAGQSNPDNFGVRRGPGVSTAAASTTQSHPEGRGRPNNPTGRYAIVARSDQAAYGRTGGPAPAYQFRFDMENLEQQGYGRGVLQAWAARNSVDPANYIVVDTTQYADQIPTIDIDVEPAPAPQLPGMGQWNGQWKVLVGGREVYRFGGVGNSQADANRIAAAWLRQNGQGVSGEGFEVYPVMDESVMESQDDRRKFADGYLMYSDHFFDRLRDRNISQTEVDRMLRQLEVRRSIDLIKMPYVNFVVKTPDLAVAFSKQLDNRGNTAFIINTVRQDLKMGQDEDVIYLEDQIPQPSHGPGAIKDLNEPLGPETPPKMPDGTIKVDVSDMYDWYKLGQKISDLDSIKPGELGSGPPSTVFAFGSEDLENMYSHELTKLGLKTHDLDEPGEEDIDESKEQKI
jgi:hypothetical protein